MATNKQKQVLANLGSSLIGLFIGAFIVLLITRDAEIMIATMLWIALPLVGYHLIKYSKGDN